jgi:hypothetical protein
MAAKQVDAPVKRGELPYGTQPTEREIELTRGFDLPPGENLAQDGVSPVWPQPVL